MEDRQFTKWLAEQEPKFLNFMYMVFKTQPVFVTYNGPMKPIANNEIAAFDLFIKTNQDPLKALHGKKD